MSHNSHSTPEQREERKRRERKARMDKWASEPPKPRKYPATHPWREYRQTKAEGEKSSAEQLNKEEMK